jgi:hypothetical protein
MIYIENEGALFRGPSRSFPKEVWGHKTHTWHPILAPFPSPSSGATKSPALRRST